MQEIAIIAPLVPMGVGDTFDYGKVELHLTVLSNVRIAADTAAVVDAVEGVASRFSPVESVALDYELFGPDADIVVTEIRVSGELRALHDASLDVMTRLGATPVTKAIHGPGYRAHVTRTWQGDEIAPGSAVRLDRLAVLDCSAPMRRVV